MVDVLRILRFGAVGLVATFIHSVTYALIVTTSDIEPLLANIGGYLLAVVTSFAGHQLWTFRVQAGNASMSRTIPRFLATSVMTLGLNSLGVWIIADLLQWPPLVAVIPMLTVVPPLTYLVMRNWVFNSAPTV